MGIKELISNYMEKKRREKTEFKMMQRDVRLRRKLEDKMKSPAQKEYEFYQREKERIKLNADLKKEREERKKRLAKLSDPYNKLALFRENNDIMNVKNPLMLKRNVFKNSIK